MSSMICIDAGPVIQLVAFPEKNLVQKKWEEWEEQGLPIYAPVLLYYEITNVLHRYRRFGVLSDMTVQALLSAALSLPIELIEDRDLHFRAAEIAADFGLSAAYDAHYLALAERIGAEFWTSDQKLQNQLIKQGVDWIHLMPSD